MRVPPFAGQQTRPGYERLRPEFANVGFKGEVEQPEQSGTEQRFACCVEDTVDLGADVEVMGPSDHEGERRAKEHEARNAQRAASVAAPFSEIVPSHENGSPENDNQRHADDALGDLLTGRLRCFANGRRLRPRIYQFHRDDLPAASRGFDS